MGLTIEGIPLDWDQTKPHIERSKTLAIQRFIFIYKMYKDRCDNELKWGDEVEYNIVHFQDQKKSAKLALKCFLLLQQISEQQNISSHEYDSLWHHEYNEYMIEGIPREPYGGKLTDLRSVEENMKKRRTYLQSFLLPNETPFSSSFLRIGCPPFTIPEYTRQTDDENSYLDSNFLPVNILSKHIRYKNIACNMRTRRGDKYSCSVKIFLDKNTTIPVEGSLPDQPDTVHLDCNCFGFGLCCLQVTFQATNLTAAKRLHDQLAPLAAIMLALSASTPAHRGYLVESDCRWNIIKTLADERTREERDKLPKQEGQTFVYKLRYDTISMYISSEGERYNDRNVAYDEKIYKILRDEKIDPLLSRHVAHSFTRDPITLFDNQMDEQKGVHFPHYEYFTSIIWPSVKLKVPPSASVGWRVEFRTMESQITDFESAAYACFINLVVRLILHNDLNLLIPLSRVNENMDNAQKRNALNTEKFWFRQMIYDYQNGTIKYITKKNETIYDDCNLMTINQIINGNNSFPGLIPLVKEYISSKDVDMETGQLINTYLKLISKRASGELLTAASWIRKEVLNHPEYKKDSIITDEMNFYILTKIKQINDKLIECPELLGLPNENKSTIYHYKKA